MKRSLLAILLLCGCGPDPAILEFARVTSENATKTADALNSQSDALLKHRAELDDLRIRIEALENR